MRNTNWSLIPTTIAGLMGGGNFRSWMPSQGVSVPQAARATGKHRATRARKRRRRAAQASRRANR
jgi:hypothetical protein